MFVSHNCDLCQCCNLKNCDFIIVARHLYIFHFSIYISQCYFVSHYCDFVSQNDTISHCDLISQLFAISDNCDFNSNCDFIVIVKCSPRCDVFLISK